MNEAEGATIALGIITEHVRGLDSSAESFTAQITSARVVIEQASEQVVLAEARRDQLVAAGYAIALANGIFWEPYPEPEPEPEPEPVTPTPEPLDPTPISDDGDEPVLADVA